MTLPQASQINEDDAADTQARERKSRQQRKHAKKTDRLQFNNNRSLIAPRNGGFFYQYVFAKITASALKKIPLAPLELL